MGAYRGAARFQVRRRLLALCLGCVLVTAVLFAATGAWRMDRLVHAATVASGSASDGAAHAQLSQAASGTAQLVAATGDAVRAAVGHAESVAVAELASRGGLRLGTWQVTWRVVNQLTGASRTVALPRARVGGVWLGQNGDPRVPTPLVDDIRARVGGSVSVYQRMNPAGDLLRVATNALDERGRRAIGGYRPATRPDGSADGIIARIRKSRPYRGVVEIMGTWSWAVFTPLVRGGAVIGAVAVSHPLADGLAAAVAGTKIGTNGSVSVISACPADLGRVIASSDPRRAGTVRLDAVDAHGTRYVEEILRRAIGLGNGEVFHTRYRLPGRTASRVGDTDVEVRFYRAYRWVVLAQVYRPDFAVDLGQVSGGRAPTLLTWLLSGLVLAVLAAVAAVRYVRRDENGRDENGRDESGRDGVDPGAAAGQASRLRHAYREISATAGELREAAGQVVRSGEVLGGAVERTSQQVSATGRVAGEVSHHVENVATGSEEVVASTGAIAGNAREAAGVAEETVVLARRASQVMGQLDESSARIGNVVNLIRGIAKQTNLLALNATIEAARAGIAGRGFAVVAGEVKELAQQTARATDDVTRQVSAIKSDAVGAIDVINQIGSSIERVSEFQRAIAAAVEEQTKTTAMMSRTVGEAATVSDEIAEGVAAVGATVVSTREALAASQAATTRLDGLAEQLRRQVSGLPS